MRTAVALGTALALAACAGHVDPTTSGVSGGSVAPAQTVNIVSDPNTIGAFDLKTVNVKVDQAVQWNWLDSSNIHTVTAEDGSFDSGPCSPGSAFVVTFSKPGTYRYKCTIHAGMQGTVIVT